jgi:hypothetical protein
MGTHLHTGVCAHDGDDDREDQRPKRALEEATEKREPRLSGPNQG